jgi:hypothetical protein
MTHSSSKSAGCRPGSTREQGRLSRSAGTSDRHGRANPRLEKYVICPRVSNTTSPTTPGSGRHPHLVASARTWLPQRCFFARCRSHQPPRVGESRGSSRISVRRRGPMGRELCLPKAGIPLGTSCRDFPIHAGSLGLHRAHAQHRACGPGSPRQRALSPRPSGPPRREGAPRLPPQAWGTPAATPPSKSGSAPGSIPNRKQCSSTSSA